MQYNSTQQLIWYVNNISKYGICLWNQDRIICLICNLNFYPWINLDQTLKNKS